jgi:hypothetical protein
MKEKNKKFPSDKSFRRNDQCKSKDKIRKIFFQPGKIKNRTLNNLLLIASF